MFVCGQIFITKIIFHLLNDFPFEILIETAGPSRLIMTMNMAVIVILIVLVLVLVLEFEFVIVIGR
jgi:hypothetical protein